MPEVQKKATFEERVFITEERTSVAIPEEIPSPEGTLYTDNSEELVLCLQVCCSKTKIRMHKIFMLVISYEFCVEHFTNLQAVKSLLSVIYYFSLECQDPIPLTLMETLPHRTVFFVSSSHEIIAKSMDVYC